MNQSLNTKEMFVRENFGFFRRQLFKVFGGYFVASKELRQQAGPNPSVAEYHGIRGILSFLIALLLVIVLAVCNEFSR